MAGKTKTPVLVLCHTIFHNAFRTSTYGGMNAEKFNKWLRAKFLADFVVELGSEATKEHSFTYTSKRVFEEFYASIEKECREPEVFVYLDLIKKLV